MPYTISIGRSRSNDIVIDNVAVSNSHALLTFGEDGTIIYTDNSTNGTKINGKIIHKRGVYLRGNEIIVLPGNIILGWGRLNSHNPYTTLQGGPQPQTAQRPEPQPVPQKPEVPSGVYEAGPVVTEVPERRNTCGLLSLIFAIVAIPFYIIYFLSFIGMLFGLAAFILGFIGVFRSPRGKAIAGMILSVIVPVIWWIIIISAIGVMADVLYM